MSLAEMKAQIRELSPNERAELERFLAALSAEDDVDWQERAFQDLRDACQNPERLKSLSDLRELHHKLSEQGR